MGAGCSTAQCYAVQLHSCRDRVAPGVSDTNIANAADAEECHCAAERRRNVGGDWRIAVLRRFDSRRVHCWIDEMEEAPKSRG